MDTFSTTQSKRPVIRRVLKSSTLVSATSLLLLSACATPQTKPLMVTSTPDELLIIDCLLPGQVRQLGTKMVFLSPRRPIKTSAARCGISGGEYVAFDRADAATSLKIWLPQAEEGDPQAQTYVGEIFEKGLGVEPDYSLAASWYERAAAQGYTRARINLGYLYESGLGVTQDLPQAMNLYRQASGIEQGTLEYVSTVEFAQRENAKRETVALETQVDDLSEQLADSEARYRAVQTQVRIDQAALEELSQKIKTKRQEVINSYQADRDALAPTDAPAAEAAKTLIEIGLVKDQLASTPGASSDNDLKRRESALESEYRKSIARLQSELELSETEQHRVANQLADNERAVQSIASENQLLRDRLREQNNEVEKREGEQQRLSAKLASLALSEQASQTEKRAAQASTRAANAELELARFEQSRLVTKLIEAQLNQNSTVPAGATQLAILEKQLTLAQGVVGNRQQQVSELEQSITRNQAQFQSTSSEQFSQIVAVGPTIEIIEPPLLLTRGPGKITARADGTVDLVGRVSPTDNLVSFSINGQRQVFNSSGIFNFQSTQAIDNIQLTAVDSDGMRASVNFSIATPPSQTTVATQNTQTPDSRESFSDIDFGSYHAIIIGNNDYDELSDLRTPQTDAQTIDSLLRNQYGFTTQLLINATQLDILTALNTAREKLTENDNLIVYYAGHGQLDPDEERGYWLPVDATVSSTDKWISNAVVTNFLDTIPARQIMVVADSCFSGTLTKASIPRMQDNMPQALRKQWLTLMAKQKVRTVLSSGGVKPVYDGVNKHSLFASAFIEQLSENQGVLAGHRLYSTLRNDVQQSAITLGVDQIPQYAAAKYAGHEVGEFLFVSR